MNAPAKVSAFGWVPDFARGNVRDLRIRWALEEAGIGYDVRLLDATGAVGSTTVLQVETNQPVPKAERPQRVKAKDVGV